MLPVIVVTLVCFCFADCLQNPYCSLPCDYGTGPVLHTVCERDQEKCGPSPNCGPNFKIIEMTDEMREFFLDLHNSLRNKVASGNETRDEQPSASNMNVLNYDRELEFIAQCWANTCNGRELNHDFCRRTKRHPHVGQNLAFFNSSTDNFDLKGVLKELVMAWYEEVAIYKKDWIESTQDLGPSYVVGHYTQLVWADTTDLGCAIAYYTTPRDVGELWHLYLLVCNYSPSGNFIGAPVYNPGKPCSSCPHYKGCNRKYRSLCGAVRNVRSSTFTPFFEY